MDVPGLRLVSRVCTKMLLGIPTGKHSQMQRGYVCTLFVYVRTYYDRGHTVNAVCESFQGAKDAGFKVWCVYV